MLRLQAKPFAQLDTDSLGPTDGGLGLPASRMVTWVAILRRELSEKDQASAKPPQGGIMGQDEIEQCVQVVNARDT
jgi:hypothetical protein